MSATTTDTTPTLRMLDASDLEHHKFVLTRIAEAQSLLRWWSQMLTAKYHLAEHDSVTPNGEIHTHTG